MVGSGSRGHSRRGAAKTETVLIVLGVAIAVLVAITLFGNRISSQFSTSTGKLDGPGGGGAAPAPGDGGIPVSIGTGVGPNPADDPPVGSKPTQKSGGGVDPGSAVGHAIETSGAGDPGGKSGKPGVETGMTKGGAAKKGEKPDKNTLLEEVGGKSDSRKTAMKTGNSVQKNAGPGAKDPLDQAADAAGKAAALARFNRALRAIDDKAGRGEPPGPDDVRAVLDSLESAIGDRLPPRLRQIVENSSEHLKTAQDAQDFVNALRILAESAGRDSDNPVQPLRDLGRFVRALKPAADKIPGAGSAIGGFLDYYGGSLDQAASQLERVHASRQNPSQIWNDVMEGTYYQAAAEGVEAQLEAEGHGLPESVAQGLETRAENPADRSRRTDVYNAEKAWFGDDSTRRREHARNETDLSQARLRLVDAAERLRQTDAVFANEDMELRDLQRELPIVRARSRGGRTPEEAMAALREVDRMNSRISSLQRAAQGRPERVERARQDVRAANEDYQRRLVPVRATEEAIAQTLASNRPGNEDEAWRREHYPHYVPGSNPWGVPSHVQEQVDAARSGR